MAITLSMIKLSMATSFFFIVEAAPVAPMFVPVTTERWTQAPVVPVFHTLLSPSHTPQSRTTSPKHVFAIANINQPSHRKYL